MPQETISSLLLHAPRRSSKKSPISLTDFLNRKLQSRAQSREFDGTNNLFRSPVEDESSKVGTASSRLDPDKFQAMGAARREMAFEPYPSNSCDSLLKLPTSFGHEQAPVDLGVSKRGLMGSSLRINKKQRTSNANFADLDVVAKEAEQTQVLESPELYGSWRSKISCTTSDKSQQKLQSTSARAGRLTEDERACCPICNTWMDAHTLQQHVEQELDILDSSEALREEDNHQRVARKASLRRETHQQGMHTLSSFQLSHEVELMKKLERGHDNILVLGDDPKTRYKPSSKGKRPKNKTNPIFNHYADGGGWWGEGAVGVAIEEVGCTGTWEGFGSMTFGPSL